MPKGTLTGLEKENVLIQAGDCAITLLPHLGGKISSIRLKNKELLQTPLATPAPRTQTMPFDAGDASGWDECLPSVAECSITTATGTSRVPDHGDLWRVAWEQVAGNGKSLELYAECFSLPLALSRTLELSENGKGYQLKLNYKLTNTGGHRVPWSWAAHPLFAAEAGDRIVLPASIHSLRVEGSGHRRLGGNGDSVAWPIATLADGSKSDLSIARPAASEIGDKLFTGPLQATENWCALERSSAGVRIRVSFNTAATPYLGLWICCGGWPDRSGPKQMCVAMEPSTAPVDSLAETGPWSRELSPGQSFSWPMNVDLELI